jgi:hypothetical protein
MSFSAAAAAAENCQFFPFLCCGSWKISIFFSLSAAAAENFQEIFA